MIASSSRFGKPGRHRLRRRAELPARDHRGDELDAVRQRDRDEVARPDAELRRTPRAVSVREPLELGAGDVRCSSVTAGWSGRSAARLGEAAGVRDHRHAGNLRGERLPLSPPVRQTWNTDPHGRPRNPRRHRPARRQLLRRRPARDVHVDARATRPCTSTPRNGVWGIASYAALLAVAKDPTTFSNAGGIRPDTGPIPMMIDMDDPEHWKRRKLVNKGFTPRRVRDSEQTDPRHVRRDHRHGVRAGRVRLRAATSRRRCR